MGTQSPSSQNPTWHEFVLDKLEHGNNVFVLLHSSHDVIAKTRIKVWAVKSDSDPMMWYYVMDLPQVGGTTHRVCSCDGFRYANHCKHTGRVPEK